MKYTVEKIEEDINFGCEERAEGTQVPAVVTLLDEKGQRTVQKFPDAVLLERDIQEGDQVIIDETGMLQKLEHTVQERSDDR